jgi:outer membrane protein, heavy metal efflux system
MMRTTFLFLSSLITLHCFSQRQLSLKEAETELQKNNALLLAESYNISASQAAVIQAKIWEQPYLSADFNAINPEANRFFDILW